MKNLSRLSLAAVCTVLVTSMALGQEAPEGPFIEAQYDGHTFSRIDHDALSQMSREDRRAYMQAFKQRRAAEAAAAGLTPPSGRQMTRLDEPRATGTAQRAGVGTVQYDTGTVFGFGGVASQMVGNRFDSALNTAGTMCCFPLEATGTISMITFDMVNTFFGSVVFSLYSDIMSTMAVQVTSMARPGIMTGLNTLAVMSPTTANAYMNGAFLAGIWQFSPTMTGLGLDSGTTNGLGFHAISLNDGAAGTGLTTVTTAGMGVNAVFRVSGPILTPVELLSFDIED